MRVKLSEVRQHSATSQALQAITKHINEGAELGRYVGNGYFSEVYQVGPFAIRRSKRGDDLTRTYHALIRDGKITGAPVPKVYATVSHDGVFYSVMEFIPETMQDKVDREHKPNNDVWWSKWDDFADRYPHISSVINYTYNNNAAETADPEGVAIIDKLMEYGIDTFDIHLENIMVRADGQWVLTDPVSFRKFDTNGRTKKRTC